MGEVLQIVGGLAGVGGIALGIFLFIYRDLVRDLIHRRAFRTLTSEHATILLGSVIVFTFSIAILGLFAGLAAGAGAGRFIVLVGIILIFILAIVLVVTRRQTPGHGNSKRSSQSEEFFFRVGNLIDSNRLDEADRELSRSAVIYQGTANFFYWKSRVALARSNFDGAEAYADKALNRDPRHEYSVALKIKILLLGGRRDAHIKARALAGRSHGISDTLDSWIMCLTEKGMFEPGVRSNSELDMKCPYPASARSDDLRPEDDGVPT